MKLYYNPISTYSQKVLLAFYEKGIEFEPSIVSLMDPEAGAAYREVYPLGKIPCLVVDDDHIIPESSIIIEYIDGMAEPRLIDGDSEQTRKIRFKDRMIDLYLNDNVVTLLFQSPPHFQLIFSWKWADSELITRVTIDLRAIDDDQTELTLTHEGFPETEIRDRHVQGWEGCLAKLPNVIY